MSNDTDTPFDEQSERQLDEIIETMRADIQDNPALTAVYMSRVEPVNMFLSLDVVKEIISALGRVRTANEKAGASLEAFFGSLARQLIITYAQDGRRWIQPLDDETQQLLTSFRSAIDDITDLATEG